MPVETVPAATLILFRTGVSDDEHLFVERAQSMAFAGGATVFPGGRVDPDDHLLAQRFPSIAPEDAAARIAAIRETIEETGVAIGIRSEVDHATIVRLRVALHDRAPLSALLTEERLDLDLDALVPFARWCPNFNEVRNFDTRFYLARLPDDAHPARVDATENVHLFWATARDVLERADAGQLSIIFPTRRNLERLASLAGFDAAAAQAGAIAIDVITPRVEMADGERHLVIAEGLGYPVTRERMASARRG